MNACPGLVVTVLIFARINFFGATANKSAIFKPRNGSIMEGISRVQDHITRPGLIMLSVQIAEGRNITNSTKPNHFLSDIFSFNGGKSKDIELYEPPKSSSFFRFKDISMHSLYFVASMSLLVLLLMIIKLVLSKREKTKEYNLVTKGDFEAWNLNVIQTWLCCEKRTGRWNSWHFICLSLIYEIDQKDNAI